MKFEVIKDKQVKMIANDKECMPSSDVLTQLQEAGYIFKYDKKSWGFPKKRGRGKKIRINY
jgi:hypothetical protein